MIVSHLLLILHKKIQFYIFVWSLKCGKRSQSSRGPKTFARHCILYYLILGVASHLRVSVYSPSSLLEASRTMNVPSGVSLIFSFTSSLETTMAQLKGIVNSWKHHILHNINLPWADSTRRPNNLPGLNGMRETTSSRSSDFGVFVTGYLDIWGFGEGGA